MQRVFGARERDEKQTLFFRAAAHQRIVRNETAGRRVEVGSVDRKVSRGQRWQVYLWKLQSLARMNRHQSHGIDLTCRRRQMAQLFFFVQDLEAANVFEERSLRIFHRPGTKCKCKLK